MSKVSSFELEQIKKVSPHGYPFLFLDRILELVYSEDPDRLQSRIVAIKNVTFNENFFQGHFSENAVMPGVLILECLAQAAGFILLDSKNGPNKDHFFLGSIYKARFRKPVVPGDQLRLEALCSKKKGHVFVCEGVAKVGGDVVAEAEFALVRQSES